MSRTYNKSEIISRATALRTQGKTWLQIASALRSEGYLNQGGKPYSQAGIHTLVSFTRPDLAPRKASQTSSRLVSDPMDTAGGHYNSLAKREKAVIELSKSIIDLQGVDSETKLGLLSRALTL